MKKLTKTGQVAGVQGFIMAIVGVAVILAVGLIVLSELQTSTTENSTAYNSTGTIITKLATVPTWIGILITVALAFIVLGYFYTRG
jgi:predicted RND superfamily exporter protein